LISFNNFLSTSKSRNISQFFAQSPAEYFNTYGILFIIHVDPTSACFQFADVSTVSPFEHEQEILFSMCTVFRIGEVVPSKTHHRLFEVLLTPVIDQHPSLARSNQLKSLALTEFKIPELSLLQLLFHLKQINMAEKVYNNLRISYSNIYPMIEFWYKVKNSESALEFRPRHRFYKLDRLENHFQNSFETNPHSVVATGVTGENLEPLSYFLKELEKMQELLPENYSDLADAYHDIGTMNGAIEEYAQAIIYVEKELEIRQKSQPEDHPDFAKTYDKIALTYHRMKNYSKALEYFQKELGIKQKYLQEDHLHFANTYNNIGFAYYMMEDYSTALENFKREIRIRKKHLGTDHIDLAEKEIFPS
jgi:tetratricopeptide (TPR) repeat protein